MEALQEIHEGIYGDHAAAQSMTNKVMRQGYFWLTMDTFGSDLKINLHFSSLAHPQANGQVEADNKLLKHTLKKKLGTKKGTWSKLLPEVLWAYHCTERKSIGETPYSLAFGAEAVIPVEVGIPTH